MFEKTQDQHQDWIKWHKWLNSQCTLDSFRVLNQLFGGKGKLIGGFWELWELAFTMYGFELSEYLLLKLLPHPSTGSNVLSNVLSSYRGKCWRWFEWPSPWAVHGRPKNLWLLMRFTAVKHSDGSVIIRVGLYGLLWINAGLVLSHFKEMI